MEVTQKELDGMEKKGGNCSTFEERNTIIEMIDLFAGHIEVGYNLEMHKNTTQLKD